jgi:cell division protein FtsB
MIGHIGEQTGSSQDMWFRRSNLWTRQHRKRRTGALIVPTITVAFLAYFGFHAFHGEFGIYNSHQLDAQAAALKQQLAGIKAEREELEQRVQLLHDGTIEKDMLDEQARRTLNLSREDEVTIYRPVR